MVFMGLTIIINLTIMLKPLVMVPMVMKHCSGSKPAEVDHRLWHRRSTSGAADPLGGCG